MKIYEVIFTFEFIKAIPESFKLLFSQIEIKVKQTSVIAKEN